MKKFFANLALVIISIIVAIIFLEIVLRFTPYKNIGTRSYGYPDNYFVADEELGYDIAKNFAGTTHFFPEYPYKIFSNSYGCFDYQRDVPDDYALIVGDSFAWGYAPLEKKWTTYLEQKTGIFMLKCGITGHGTRQEMVKAKRVINQVGKNPRLIIVLYTRNDLNDDFLFPNRIVIGKGKLASKNKGANLITGERFFYSDEEIKQKYKRYVSGNFLSYLHDFEHSLITYRAYKNVEPELKESVENFFAKLFKGEDKPSSNAAENDQKKTKMPDYTKGYYDVHLSDYLDVTEREWLNQTIEAHKETIKNFVLYSQSVGAKFLIIDIDGTLNHPRFDDVRKFFRNSRDVYYYDLTKDYKNQSRWKFDGHWDIKGNQEAGEYIYQHFKDVGVFK